MSRLTGARGHTTEALLVGRNTQLLAGLGEEILIGPLKLVKHWIRLIKMNSLSVSSDWIRACLPDLPGIYPLRILTWIKSVSLYFHLWTGCHGSIVY